MSILDFYEAKSLAAEAQFNSLLIATILTAIGTNLAALAAAFPDVFAEVVARKKSPGFALNDAEMEWVGKNFD